MREPMDKTYKILIVIWAVAVYLLIMLVAAYIIAPSPGDDGILIEVLAAFNRALHDDCIFMREAAHEALSKLLDGKPLPGDEWVPLRERQERRKRRKRQMRRLALLLAMALPPLVYVLGVLFVPWVHQNWQLLLGAMVVIDVWIAFLANVGKVRQTLGDWFR